MQFSKRGIFVKIVDFFRNLFKKENININDLINISDSFVMPTRELFKENLEMLGLIETYKAEYKKVLSDKKLLFSMDLTNNINEDIRVYSELITNIFTKEESLEGATETKVKMFYKINKLNLYKEEISRLNEECTARLVALLELFNERKMFMSKHKKDALLFAINNLTSALVVFQAQRGAIEIEKENFLDKYTNLAMEHDNSNCDFVIKTFVEDKVNILNRVAPLIDKKLVSNDIRDILLLEFELEVFVYNNKSKVQKIKETIDEYFKIIDNEEGISKITVFDEIYDLERNALLYFYYGKNLIDIDDIYKLYELKLKYLINRGVKLDLGLPDAINIEIECYKQIIFKKIEKITSGKNTIIEKNFGYNTRNAIKYIVDELKCEGQFDVENILTSHKLYFLFSFDYEDGFINHLNNSTITRDYFSYFVNFYYSIFNWEESIPLTSLFEIIMLNNLDPKFYLDVNRFNLYKLYQTQLNYYKLPEGIKKISFTSENYKDDNFMKKLVGSAEGKKLVLPDSLETFCGQLFLDGKIEDLVLNNNINSISMSLLGCTAEILNIPSSLEHITNDIERDYLLGFNFAWEYGDNRAASYRRWYYLNNVGFKKLNTIIFHDYENSKLLQNKNTLRLLFSDTLYIHKSINSCVLKTKIKTIILKDDKRNLECVIDISDLECPLIPENYIKNGAVENVIISRLISSVQSKVLHCLNNDNSLLKC